MKSRSNRRGFLKQSFLLSAGAAAGTLASWTVRGTVSAGADESLAAGGGRTPSTGTRNRAAAGPQACGRLLTGRSRGQYALHLGTWAPPSRRKDDPR